MSNAERDENFVPTLLVVLDTDLTVPTLLQADLNRNLFTTMGTLLSGENQTLNRETTIVNNTYSNITTATTTVVKGSAGYLHSITVNTTAAGTITIYDNTSAAGSKIGTLKASIGENTYVYDVAFGTGLTIVTGAASDITVSYL